MKLLEGKSASCLIGIGCGISDAKKGISKLGGIDVGKYAVDVIADAQIKWEEFYNHTQNSVEFKSRCIRLNPSASTKLGDYALDESGKVKDILQTYVNWLSDREACKRTEYKRKMINASK